MKDPEGLIYPPSDFILRQTVIFKTEGHFIGAVHGEKLAARILKDRGGQLADLADTYSGGVPAHSGGKSLLALPRKTGGLIR